jgi:hypothetical protein
MDTQSLAENLLNLCLQTHQTEIRVYDLWKLNEFLELPPGSINNYRRHLLKLRKDIDDFVSRESLLDYINFRYSRPNCSTKTKMLIEEALANISQFVKSVPDGEVNDDLSASGMQA